MLVMFFFTRIRTYEHEGTWGKALVTYDLEISLPPSIRQTGLVEVIINTKLLLSTANCVYFCILFYKICYSFSLAFYAASTHFILRWMPLLNCLNTVNK